MYHFVAKISSIIQLNIFSSFSYTKGSSQCPKWADCHCMVNKCNEETNMEHCPGNQCSESCPSSHCCCYPEGGCLVLQLRNIVDGIFRLTLPTSCHITKTSAFICTSSLIIIPKVCDVFNNKSHSHI